MPAAATRSSTPTQVFGGIILPATAQLLNKEASIIIARIELKLFIF